MILGTLPGFIQGRPGFPGFSVYSASIPAHLISAENNTITAFNEMLIYIYESKQNCPTVQIIKINLPGK